jgi:hypothetical protein
MPVRSAYRPGSGSSRRRARRHAAPPRSAPDAGPFRAEPRPAEPLRAEPFRVASRDRLIPRQREGAPDEPRVSYEVILAVAIVVACMCGAMAVGAAFTVQV